MSRFIDLTGQQFGRWIVLRYDPLTGKWLCRCECGKEKAVLSGNLRSGKSTGCGCIRGGKGSRLKDLTGQKFGRLLVLGLSYIAENNQSHWRCLCDCGKEAIVRSGHLGVTTFSCGCYASDRISLASTKHGHTANINDRSSRTYRSWHSMMSRCNNPNSTNFKYWGGRGIKVCERWTDFRNFLTDMGERPEGKSLDRYPSPDGNYEPDNCRWATPAEQVNNRSTT